MYLKEPYGTIRKSKELILLVINLRWLGERKGEEGGGEEKRLLDMPLATPGM